MLILKQPNKVSLREISRVMRLMNRGSKKEGESVKTSLQMAKDAVSKDPTDSESWCMF